MVVVLFRARLAAAAGEEYGRMADELLARARTMPGFVDFKSYEAADGEHLAVIRWQSHDTLRAWSDDLRHAVAQRMGREQWYHSFHVEVTEVTRSYGFDKDRPPA